MEDVKLSEKAKQQVAGLEATNQRLLAEGLELEARTRVLEALAQCKETMVRRYQEFLAEVQAERQAIEAEYQRKRQTIATLRRFASGSRMGLRQVGQAWRGRGMVLCRIHGSPSLSVQQASKYSSRPLSVRAASSPKCFFHRRALCRRNQSTESEGEPSLGLPNFWGGSGSFACTQIKQVLG